MYVETFDPKERAIWVDVRLFGPMGASMLRFVLDTGTPVTVVRTSAIDELGYSARMANARSRLIGVDGTQEGYRLEVERLEALGLIVERREVFCHDFDEGLGVDGLIGMDLLEGHVLTLDGIQGILTVA